MGHAEPVLQVKRSTTTSTYIRKYDNFFLSFFWPQGEVFFPLCPEILQWLCLPSEFSTLRDAGFEPGTTDSAVWSAANEPPHLQQVRQFCQNCYGILFIIYDLYLGVWVSVTVIKYRYRICCTRTVHPGTKLSFLVPKKSKNRSSKRGFLCGESLKSKKSGPV